jgi:hypothetical protein
MSSFNFFLKCYNIYIKEILFHLESRSKGVKTKRVGGGEERRGLTVSYFITARFFEGHLQKWKEMVKTRQEKGKIGRRHCSALARNMLYKGETKQRCVILTLVLYIQNGRRAHIYDKRRSARVRDGRQNGRCAHFRDKRKYTPRNVHPLYMHIRICAIGMHVSLLSHKWVRLGYKLN